MNVMILVEERKMGVVPKLFGAFFFAIKYF